MRKIFMTFFLTIALITPVLAENDKFFELLPKIGYVFSPELTTKTKQESSVSADSLLSIGAEIFFDTKSNLFLGIGGMWGQDTTIKHSNMDLGFTNIYSEGKYKFLVNGSKKDPLFVYPLLQLGVGFPSWSVARSDYGKEVTIVPGFYWGTGIGVEYKDIVLEFIYGCNYSKNRYKGLELEQKDENIIIVRFVDKEDPFSYTAFRINIGYKFNF